jgi:hypothetical protein
MFAIAVAIFILMLFQWLGSAYLFIFSSLYSTDDIKEKLMLIKSP